MIKQIFYKFVFYFNGCIMLFSVFQATVNAANVSCSVEISEFIFDTSSITMTAYKNTAQGYAKFTCTNQSDDTVYVNACLNGPSTLGNLSVNNSPSLIGSRQLFTFINSSTGLIWDGLSSPLSISMFINANSSSSQKVPLTAETNFDLFDIPSGVLISSFSLPPSSLSWHSSLIPNEDKCNGLHSSEHYLFSVRAILLKMCDAYADDINFGKIIESPNFFITSRSSIYIKCTSGTVYNASLRSLNGDANTFQMKNGKGDKIRYTLFKNQDRTLVWGSGSNAKIDTGTGKTQQHYVYGLINLPPRYSPPPGEFTDTVIISISY